MDLPPPQKKPDEEFFDDLFRENPSLLKNLGAPLANEHNLKLFDMPQNNAMPQQPPVFQKAEAVNQLVPIPPRREPSPKREANKQSQENEIPGGGILNFQQEDNRNKKKEDYLNVWRQEIKMKEENKKKEREERLRREREELQKEIDSNPFGKNKGPAQK